MDSQDDEYRSSNFIMLNYEILTNKAMIYMDWKRRFKYFIKTRGRSFKKDRESWVKKNRQQPLIVP